jgi:head-tail adaptor
MSPILRGILGAAMVRNLVQDRVIVLRMTLTEDGRGGQTQDWRQVDEFLGRMVNQANGEAILGGGIKVVCNWYLVAPIDRDIQAADRIRLHDEPNHYFDVIGTDQGQTNLLIQHVSLKEHFA